MNIEQYRALCKDETIALTAHAKTRLFERNITLDDIEQAVLSGKIIEEYPDDTPFPSCLICGRIVDGSALHIVVSTDTEFLYVITAYRPNPAKWTDEFMRRKENLP